MKHGFRKSKAYDLVNCIAEGPNGIGRNSEAKVDQADYNLWMSTWVLPKLTTLIPELKDMQFEAMSSRPQPNPVHIPGYSTK